jgi:Asp/Glu/hydantoin racemase
MPDVAALDNRASGAFAFSFMSFLGLLMLDTRFPRIAGDIGHPATFDFPLRRTIVRGASPERVVRGRDPALLQPFIEAGRALVADGAAAIATSCGFLALFQRELQAALPVPVWTSSLLLLPETALALQSWFTGRHAGVVTVDAASLTADHLRAVGADPATPIEGLTPGSSLQRSLLEDLPTLDAAAAEREVVAAALRLVRRDPRVGAIVLECTNMPPYAAAVRAATGLPVHDITTLLNSRWAALSVALAAQQAEAP